MAQAEHDRQYSPSQWSPRLGPDDVINDHCATVAKGSEAVRLSYPCELDVAYASGPGETLDLVTPRDGRAFNQIVVYFHGGMWQFLSKKDSLFFAAPLLDAGAAVAAVEYTVAPKGTMDTIVHQCRAAVLYLHQRFPDHHLVFAGHSAGGHLAAMMLLTDWAGLCQPNLPARIRGIVAVSGLFDLEPVQRCYANEALGLTDKQVAEYSPTRLLSEGAWSAPPGLCATVIVAFAQHDPEAFRQHSIDFHAALAALAAPSRLHVEPLLDVTEADHFEVIERMADPAFAVTKAALALIHPQGEGEEGATQ
eukprot:m.226766 g.226766  ORF g.226766 m.226766 type:complete len:307 (+) comp18805_c0_seq3:1165-2085(+)